MELALELAMHALFPVLEALSHGFTPITVVNAMTFGNVAMLFTLSARSFGGSGSRIYPALCDIAALWAMGSTSTLIWTACVISLRNDGIL